MISSIRTKMDSSSLLQRILKAIIFGIGGSVGSRALMMLTGVLVSQVLGKEFFGQFSMVNSTVTLFVTFSGLGISATLTRYVAMYRDDYRRLGNIIGTLSSFVGVLSIVMSVFLLLFSGKMSFWVSGSDVLTNYFKITSLTIFFSALASIQQSVLLGMEKYRESAKIELLRTGVYLVLSVFFSVWLGIYGALFALLTTHLLRFYLMYLENKKEYAKHDIVISFCFDEEIRNIIWTYSLPAFAASLFVMPVNWINNAILTRSVGFGELAIFSVALQWMTMTTYIPSQMGQVKPIYTDLFAHGKYDELKKVFRNITFSSVVLVLPVVVIGIRFSRNILSLYGSGYETGYVTFSLMMGTALLITMQSQIGTLLQSIGKMWAGFLLNLLWSIVIIGVFYSFKNLGSVGYAIGYVTAYGVHTVSSYCVVIYYFSRKERL